ncbi:hypothetical protein [Halomicrobium salinisoli]|uniref:hypothetical protein n=1 Tax=Halomicrobium salinisoli TaxID=2878391 RepID=UPI001CF03AA2|nr:hypothetical protein [Halomicrobium salinisoli]
MLFVEHESATCPLCGSPVWYALKEEVSGWKVFYQCRGPSGCGSEWQRGRVALSDVDSRDEAYEQAASMNPAGE